MIPVHAPVIGDEEIANVMEALTAGDISGSFGTFIERFEGLFADYCGCQYGVAVSSGSTALHLAAVLAGIGPGDEVLMNACTNIASANAVVMQGGVVVPIDSERDTWNMDARLLAEAVGPQTKAIMPVHIYGHPVDMDEVLRVADKHRLFVIEDCAEAHGAVYRGRRVGSIGHVGCFSFYANKILTTGEGGMLVTNDRQLAERARSLRNLAFGAPRFLHHEVGYNYRMTNVQAAIGCGQFTRLNETLAAKRRVAAWYTERLREVTGLRLPVEKPYAMSVYWMYGVVVEEAFGYTRDEVMHELREYGVDSRTMFCPMNLQPALLDRGATRPMRGCPVAEDLWHNGLYLPSSTTLGEHDVAAICHVIQEMSVPCA